MIPPNTGTDASLPMRNSSMLMIRLLQISYLVSHNKCRYKPEALLKNGASAALENEYRNNLFAASLVDAAKL